MSIQQEEILIKEFRSGTTVTFFSDKLKVDSQGFPNDKIRPTIVYLSNLGTPISVSTFDGKNLWTLSGNNVYIPTAEASNNFLTGYSFEEKIDYVVTPERIEVVKQRFVEQIEADILGPTGTTIGPHTEYVFSDYHEIDDFYVNVKLNRTTATLDTFNVYNNLVNSMPTQDAETGVVFGRLMALQTIKDAEGNNIRIPLRNTPVGVFNASGDYPTSSSVSENGDRIFLNLKESASQGEYFNVESFNFDKDKLLRSGSQFTSVPEQYRYMTKTNDEGEFVLYDVPVGNQIVVFEVDLLKQGLTRDEIALNFFPFPPDNNAIIDQIPNFSFKQFPINVVPAWGTIQTGYTELDVVLNIDLRKWTTYFFPPISLYGQRLETSVAQNAGNTFKVKVRDMAQQGYPNTDIKITEVQNDLDRIFNQQLNWQLEFAQIKNKAEFYRFGCPIIKLPANLYDPFGYKTDADGVPTGHKGVWLSAYQLKINTEGSSATRATGGQYAWNGSDMYFKSHYDLNYSFGVPDTSPHPPQKAGLGQFPYEQPWTIDYPNRYSIPAKPTDQRYQYGGNRTPTSNPNLYYLDEPAYNDGDLIGYEVEDADGKYGGGFGSQSGFERWFHNRIAESVTKNFMYKYESGVAWNETYANGYEPSNPGYTRFAGVSQVVGGEKYQRFESGYGYFLKPLGWPRVARTLWGADTYFGPDISFGQGLGGSSTNPGPSTTAPTSGWGNLWASNSHINDIYNIANINVALALDSTNILKEGTLEAYRVINSNPNNLAEPKNFALPTYIRLNNGASASRAIYFQIKNRGDIAVTVPNSFGAPGLAYVNGILVGPGEYLLQPGESIWANTGLGWTGFDLKGNASYNPLTNRYDIAKYDILCAYNGDVEYSQPRVAQISATADLATSIPQYFVKTEHGGGTNGRISYGLNADYGGESAQRIWHIKIENNDLGYGI